MGTSDLKLNLWLKQRPRLMLCYSKADRGILIGSLLQISKHMSAYRTTYQHSSSCRFLLRWSWRGERRLNSKCGPLPAAKSPKLQPNSLRKRDLGTSHQLRASASVKFPGFQSRLKPLLYSSNTSGMQHHLHRKVEI